MPQSKDKKIIVYFFLLILLGSINNKYFNNSQIFQLKNLKLEGLNEKEKYNLLMQLEPIKSQNIFSLPERKLIKILNSNNLIESFLIKKKYPSDLNIVIKKTSFLANISIEDQNFLIGSNKKLINSQSINLNLPFVYGNSSVKDFFLIKEDIHKSLINFKDIDKLYFFPSKRWDLKLKSGVLVKLPIINPVEALNSFYHVKSLSQFSNVKVFDMRINKQMIINEL